MKAGQVTRHAVVLLSGGMDSVAAMCWAAHRYNEVRALAVDYGQPNRDAEIFAARSSAEVLGIAYTGLRVTDALMSSHPGGLLGGVSDADTSDGVDKAFVPGRNLLLATIACAHACTWWPGSFDVVIGACAEDQGGFPDCRPTTLAQLAHALQLGCLRDVTIRVPWADRTKSELLYAIQPDSVAFDLVRRSWSCYRANGPCGTCGACVKRARAFASLGVEDLCMAPRIHGGDPQRVIR